MKLTKNAKSQSKKPATPKTKAIATKRTTRAAKPEVIAPIAAPRHELTTETIAARAYSLWEKDGRPPGRDLEYWLQAESQLKQQSHSFAA